MKKSPKGLNLATDWLEIWHMGLSAFCTQRALDSNNSSEIY